MRVFAGRIVRIARILSRPNSGARNGPTAGNTWHPTRFAVSGGRAGPVGKPRRVKSRRGARSTGIVCGEAFTGFMRLGRDPKWRDANDSAIQWYVELKATFQTPVEAEGRYS